MKKQLIGVLVCFIMLAVIPLAAGMTAPTCNTTGTTALKKTVIWGLIANPTTTGKTVTFRALWIHYRTIGGGEVGKITGQKLTIENHGLFVLKPRFIMGLVDGELQ
jgi:hypothetical protein